MNTDIYSQASRPGCGGAFQHEDTDPDQPDPPPPGLQCLRAPVETDQPDQQEVAMSPDPARIVLAAC